MDNDQQLKEYINKLPSELKQAIFSVDYQKQLQEIVKRNRLMIDQAGKLEIETTLIMAGMEPMNEYNDNLVKNVGLNRNLATIVAHDVDELIFKNIREALKKMNDEDVVSETPNNKEPSREQILSEIENPSLIKVNSVSLSSLGSNSNTIQESLPEKLGQNIEIKRDILPEVIPESSIVKKAEMSVLPKNISPISNIIETKSTQTVIFPKQQIVVEEKTKLPEKPKVIDPYREPLI